MRRRTKEDTGRGRRVQSPKKEILPLSPHIHKSKSNDVTYFCNCVTNFFYTRKKYKKRNPKQYKSLFQVSF